uniref:Uncharacterized protein n=1 Tax=Panagrellus redivivus TaxID=6233 RepID=A0A7E4VSJ6_PANRE
MGSIKANNANFQNLHRTFMKCDLACLRVSRPSNQGKTTLGNASCTPLAIKAVCNMASPTTSGAIRSVFFYPAAARIRRTPFLQEERYQYPWLFQNYRHIIYERTPPLPLPFVKSNITRSLSRVSSVYPSQPFNVRRRSQSPYLEKVSS